MLRFRPVFDRLLLLLLPGHRYPRRRLLPRWSRSGAPGRWARRWLWPPVRASRPSRARCRPRTYSPDQLFRKPFRQPWERSSPPPGPPRLRRPAYAVWNPSPAVRFCLQRHWQPARMGPSRRKRRRRCWPCRSLCSWPRRRCAVCPTWKRPKPLIWQRRFSLRTWWTMRRTMCPTTWSARRRFSGSASRCPSWCRCHHRRSGHPR